MKTIALILVLIASTATQVWAGAAPSQPTEQTSPNAAVAPILIPEGNDHTRLAVVTAEHTAQRPDALTILREELQRQAEAEQARAQRDGVFVSTTKRFAPESLTFFVAIGAVTFNTMWIRSHGDPLQMERHLASIKDPIAHISFYAFMQTQGFYMDLRTRRLGLNAMDESTRRQMLRRLSYQGMAVGSLASSLVADLGQSVKMCVDKWLKGKTDEQSLASCNEAWRQWTVRDKFTQYFPQIISMWASQAATEIVEATAMRAFDRMAMSAFIRNIMARRFLVNFAYKITAADVVLTFGGGGWFTKSIKVIGRVARFGLFVGIDQLLSKFLYRPIDNLIQPAFFNFDVMGINSSWSEADRGYWNQANIRDPRSVKRFEDRIENFGKRMQQWRDHLNQDADMDLNGWMEMTKKILSQVDYSYKYYKGFSNTLFEYLYTGNKIHNGELDGSAAKVISRYPFRTLPFYGVSAGPYRPVGGQIQDLYMISPNEMEQRQKQHALAVGQAFRGRADRLDIKVSEKQEYNNQIIAKILSGNNNTMATGFKNMNMTLDIYEMQMRSEAAYSPSSPSYIDLLYALRRALGDPRPVVYPMAGYSQAFASNSVTRQTAEEADFGKWSITQKFQFNKEADLMFYSILCGNPQGSLHKIQFAGVNFVSPQFAPPTMLKPGANRQAFCNSIITTDNLYSTKINNEELSQFIIHNIDFRIVGDFTKNEENAEAFEAWWLRAAKAPISAEFKNYDKKFQKVYQTAYNNFFDHRSLYKYLVDILNQSRYLQPSMQANLKFETNLYLQILTRSLLAGPVPPAKERLTFSSIWNAITFSPFNYVEYPRKNSVENNFVSMYDAPVPAEVTRIYGLMNQYYIFLLSSRLNFDAYIAQSKKVDTAINDALVRAGLKRVVTNTVNDSDDLLAPSLSGNELSEKTYEDVRIPNMTYRQRMTVAAVKGLRLVEAELRRFIRMRVMLSQSLDVDNREFTADWNNANPPIHTGPRSANPFGTN